MGEPKQARRQLRLCEKRGRVEMECRGHHAYPALLHMNEGVDRTIKFSGSIAVAIISQDRSKDDLREASRKGPGHRKRYEQLVPVGPPLLHRSVLAWAATGQQA